MKKITLLFIVLFTSACMHAQLNGTYTIDAAQPATATNYQSVNAAVGDLATGVRSDAGPINGPGVSAAVTIRLVASSGPYNEQVTIPAITGASATNTIRITGGPSREEITFTGTTTTDRQVIKLNGARHITLDSLTLTNADIAFGFGVHITNSADSNSVTNCNVSVYNASTSANFAGIVIGGAAVTTNGDWGDDNLIQGNNVQGGYYGITMRGTGTAVFNQRNKIINNTISDIYFYGVYCIYQNLAEISRNKVSGRSSQTASSYGIYVSNADLFTIERNRVSSVGLYGIFITTGNNQNGTGTVRARVANNMIGGGWLSTTPYGIYISGTSRLLDIWHNSVSMTSGNGRALYLLGGSGNDISNNSLAYFGSATGYALYVTTAAMVNTVNYNNYHAPGSSNFIFIASAFTPATYIGGGGFNANSRNGDPVYINNFTNLHTSAMQLFDAGTNLGVTIDFDGNTRPMAPTALYDIGADEYTPSVNDAGISALTNPVQPFAAGLQNMNAVVYNHGAATLTSATVNWTVNNVLQTPYNWTGSVAPNAAAAAVTIGTYTFASGTTYALRLWTSNPNALTDQNLLNDTLNLTVCVGLNGTYTIGGVGADYPTISAAVSALVCGGAAGPVTMRLNAGQGPFNEQVIIPFVAGASPTRPVRFTGGPTRETVTYNGNLSAERGVFVLTGAHNITLDSMTIVNTGTTQGYGVKLTNSADSNTVQNCIVRLDTSLTSSNFAGITISGATVTTNGNWGSSNLIQNNTVTGGYYGITNRGFSTTVFNQNNKIINNVVNGFYYYGIYSYYQNKLVVDDNEVTARTARSTAAYGIHIGYADSLNVERNKVNAFGTYGIYMTYANYQGGTGTHRARIVNNMVGGHTTGATPYGIYLTTNCRNLDLWHNSVSLNAGGGRCLYILSGSGNNVQNNSFAIFGSTAGYAAYVTNVTYVNGVDYNNYYAPGSSNFVYFGTVYTPATYIGGGGFNVNSRDGDPYYVHNFTDLHSNSPQLFDAGTNVGINADIDGDVRPMAPTALYDIGADEFGVITTNASVLSLVAPTNFTCGDSTQAITIVVSNLGANTIASLPITAQITGFVNTTINYTYTTAIPFGESDTITIGTINTYAGGTLNLVIYTQLPGDQNTANDTLQMQVVITPIAPAAVGLSDTVCAGDQATVYVNNDGFDHFWYNAPVAGVLLASGDTLVTPPLNNSQILYVESLTSGSGNITTQFSGGNGCDGAMFNFTPTVNMRLDSFDLNLGTTAVQSVDVFWRLGGYLGFETNAGAWTQLGQVNVQGAGAGQPTHIDVGSLQLIAGQTYGLYFHNPNSNIDYTTGSANFNNADATISTGAGLCDFFATVNAGRIFNGRVYYTKGYCAAPVRTPITITVRQRPVVSIGPDTTQCGPRLLDAGNPGMSYVWSNGDTTQQSLANASGQYNVLVNDGFCTNTDTVNLIINPIPPVAALAYVGTFCEGQRDTLIGVGAFTYVWSSGGTNNTEPIFPQVTTTYTVTGTDFVGCSDTATVTVTVNPQPTIAYIASDDSVCLGSSVTLNGTGAQTYTWDNSVIDGSPFTPTTSGNYTVIGSDANGCSDTITAAIVVHALPVVNYNVSNQQPCENTQVTLNGTGAVSYSWSGGIVDGMPFTASSATTSYTVIGTDANGCIDSTAATINVLPLPNVTFTATDTAVCAGNSVTLTGTGALTYIWDNNVTDAVAFTPVASSSYIVIGTDANNCTASDTATVTVNAFPTVTLNLPFSTICLNDAITLLSGGSPAGGTWSGPGVVGTNFDPMAAGNGTHAIIYVYTDANTCSAQDTQSIVVDPCIGITETSATNQLQVYPNPNNGLFTINYTGSNAAQLQAFDATGKLVFNTQILPGSMQQMEFEATGIYTLLLTNVDGTRSVQRVSVVK
ncbi:MAG: right-handed parallel beta-helix repeat-containing protein [Bacteroidia bacterium]